jgi:hypothetical protein
MSSSTSPPARMVYIARPDGDLEWLTSRPAPEDFYGMEAFIACKSRIALGSGQYRER